MPVATGHIAAGAADDAAECLSGSSVSAAHRRQSKRPHDPRAGCDTDSFRRNPPAQFRLFVDSVRLVGESQIHPDRFHAEASDRKQPRSLRSEGHALSFRGLVVRDAHGLGAASLRAVEVGYSLFEQARLQQLPVAGIAHGETTRRRWRPLPSAVLEAREKYLPARSTLADLYDPLAMPPHWPRPTPRSTVRSTVVIARSRSPRIGSASSIFSFCMKSSSRR